MPWSDLENFGGIGVTQHGVKDQRVAFADVACINFSSRLSLRQGPALTASVAVLRLNAGDKDRCPEDSSNVHPHAT